MARLDNPEPNEAALRAWLLDEARDFGAPTSRSF